MTTLSAQTFVMAVQGVDAEIRRIKDSVGGNIEELEPDEQELLLAFSQAATELKAAYLDLRLSAPAIPPYDSVGKWYLSFLPKRAEKEWGQSLAYANKATAKFYWPSLFPRPPNRSHSRGRGGSLELLF